MARVTVEDCLKNVKNRFELVMIAAKRARQLMHGKEPKVEWDNDKPTVVALREIAAGYTEFAHQDAQAEAHAEAEAHFIEVEKPIEKPVEKPAEKTEDVEKEETTLTQPTSPSAEEG